VHSSEAQEAVPYSLTKLPPSRNLDRDFGRDALDTIVKFAGDHRRDMMISPVGCAAPMSTLMSAHPRLLVKLL